MSLTRPLLFRRNHRAAVLGEPRQRVLAEQKTAAPPQRQVDPLALLRMSSTASSRAGNVIDLMTECSRATCATMRSQF